jgi:hypothetical protein
MVCKNIETYFVEAAPGAILRIDMATRGLGAVSVADAKRARRSMATIIESFAWVGDSP